MNNEQRYSNVIRESDIRADPEYKQKKEFYDKLKIQVQKQCNKLQENAIKEAQAIRDHISVHISQLVLRVQHMKVSDFCKEFGFELSDGNLMMMESAVDTIQSGESRIFRTVQRQHVAELANITNSATSSGEVLSQVQIIRNRGSVDSFVRLTKNANTYDLTPQKFAKLSSAERVLVRNEVTTLIQLLRDAVPQ